MNEPTQENVSPGTAEPKPNSEELRERSHFKPAEKNIGGLKLRPFSIATLRIAKVCDLTLFTDADEASIDEMDPEVLVRQVCVFAWGQSAPIEEVLTALDDGTWKRDVDRFEFTLTTDQIKGLLTEAGNVAAEAAAAIYELKEKESAQGGEAAPGNSSPPDGSPI